MEDKYGPETVSVTCEDCGESAYVHEDAARRGHRRCDDCEHEYWGDRLVERVLDGEGPTDTNAVLHLNLDFPERFPIRDEEHERWIVEAETDSLDGTRFLSKWVTIEEESADGPCPECTNRRVRSSYFSNGIIQGYRDECTVCGFIHAEDAG